MDKNNNKNRYQEAIYSNLIKRRNYSKIETDNFISNVLDVQKEYYNNYLEKEIEEICTTYFPITHPKSKYEVHYNGLAFSKLEASDEQEAIIGGKSYDRPLYLDLSVVNNETGEVKRVRQEKKALAKGIFFGRIPLMTNRGTFIINGVEKIVANQILRSPGVYALNKSHIKLSTKKKQLSGYICEILPYRGTQLQFVIDIIEKEDALGNIHHHDTFIKVVARNATGDEAVTFPATKILKALGFTQSEIIDTFKHDEFIINTLNHKDEYKHSTIFQDEQVRALKKIYNDLKTSSKDKKTLSSLDNKLREAVFAACEAQEKLTALREEYNNRLLEIEESKGGDNNEKLLNSVNSLHEKIQKTEAALNEQLDIMITERSASDIIKGLSISIRAAEANYSDRNKISYQDVIVDHFMNPRYFDLSAAGRYRMQRKLRITERLYKTTIAEDLKIGTKTIPAGTYIDKEHLDNIKQSLRVGKLELSNIKLHTLASAQKKHNNTVETISIYNDNEKKSFIIPIIGVSADVETTTLTIADFISTISYLISFYYGVGKTDDIDHLGNKRIRLIHEQLKNKLKAGMSKVERYVKEKLSTISSKTANEETQAKIDLKATVNSIVNTKAFQGAIRNFFNTYDLTQLLDQDNPLSEITHKRRISSMGEGGISREDPNLSIRDVHYSQYGRICPIESPEGQNIGLILSLTSLAEIDPKTGFLMTPYKRVIKGVIQNEVIYMTSLQEEEYNICEATIPKDKDNKKIIGYDGMAIVRYRSSQNVVPIEHVDFIEVTPRQIVSVAASCIPFLENDDNARALMGANMQRQAVPLLKPYAPIVGTGTEYQIAHDSGMAVIANDSGEVVSVDGNKITLQTEKAKKHYKLTKYRKSNQGTCINQTPIVTIGQKIKANQTIANGPAMQNGELALGRNPLVAFTT
jgi:DNA-directed RNA polymerase subunit beta